MNSSKSVSLETKGARRALELCEVVLELIRAHKGGIPSGELWAHIMTTGMSITMYQMILSVLMETRQINVVNHYITATCATQPKRNK